MLFRSGGTLVVDDFGRQRVEPHDLLNRWIVPLEKRVDYLTLHTGKKIEVPFEQLVVFSTNLDTQWRPIPILVAEIKGSALPEEFVLVHGHHDGWHYGVGDNAVGNATLLEMARVFKRHEGELKRSVRFAWWSGHSHGR